MQTPVLHHHLRPHNRHATWQHR